MVAQRLVRRLCEHCRAPVAAESILADSFEPMEDPELAIDEVFESVGCDHCNQTGYHGRISVCEVMLINEDFRKEAMRGTDNIHDLARKYGMRSMLIDAFDKVYQGQTSIEELFRVILE